MWEWTVSTAYPPTTYSHQPKKIYLELCRPSGQYPAIYLVCPLSRRNHPHFPFPSILTNFLLSMPNQSGYSDPFPLWRLLKFALECLYTRRDTHGLTHNIYGTSQPSINCKLLWFVGNQSSTPKRLDMHNCFLLCTSLTASSLHSIPFRNPLNVMFFILYQISTIHVQYSTDSKYRKHLTSGPDLALDVIHPWVLTITFKPFSTLLFKCKAYRNMCVSLALQIHHRIQPSPKNGFANCARARPPGPLVEILMHNCQNA